MPRLLPSRRDYVFFGTAILSAFYLLMAGIVARHDLLPQPPADSYLGGLVSHGPRAVGVGASVALSYVNGIYGRGDLKIWHSGLQISTLVVLQLSFESSDTFETTILPLIKRRAKERALDDPTTCTKALAWACYDQLRLKDPLVLYKTKYCEEQFQWSKREATEHVEMSHDIDALEQNLAIACIHLELAGRPDPRACVVGMGANNVSERCFTRYDVQRNTTFLYEDAIYEPMFIFLAFDANDDWRLIWAKIPDETREKLVALGRSLKQA